MEQLRWGILTRSLPAEQKAITICRFGLVGTTVCTGTTSSTKISAPHCCLVGWDSWPKKQVKGHDEEEPEPRPYAIPEAAEAEMEVGVQTGEGEVPAKEGTATAMENVV